MEFKRQRVQGPRKEKAGYEELVDAVKEAVPGAMDLLDVPAVKGEDAVRTGYPAKLLFM